MYKGFYVFEGNIYNVNDFDINKFQNKNNINQSQSLKKRLYINNFIFTGSNQAAKKLSQIYQKLNL